MTLVIRETKETSIRCELTRGSGMATVSTGAPFLEHARRLRALQRARSVPAGNG